MPFLTARATGVMPPLIDHYMLVLSVSSVSNRPFVQEPTTIAKQIRSGMIPFPTARAIGIMPSVIDHHLRVLSGGFVSNGPILVRTHHGSQTTII